MPIKTSTGAPLDRLLDAQKRPALTLVAWLPVLLVVGAIVWAHYSEIDEVASALGEIVPEQQVKTIQHLEGGIVQAIFVEEGARVASGDALIEIQLPVSGMNREELAIRQAGLQLSKMRLRAERDGTELVIPEALALLQPQLAQGERSAMAARLEEWARAEQGLVSQIRQSGLRVEELQAAVKALRDDLAMAKKNLAVSEDLFRDKLVSKLEHMGRQREVSRIQGELATMLPAVPKAEAALDESRAALDQQRQSYRLRILDELQRVENELLRVDEIFAEATDQKARAIIRSPIDGIVKSLALHTIGGVVQPAQALMEIVPVDSAYLLEVRLNPADRGVIELGQPARAKISAYEFLRYGVLEGVITQISPDSTLDPEGVPYYKVLVKPARNSVDEDGLLKIVPGMMAQVDIQVGTRSILSALIEPFVRVPKEALRERL